MHKTKLNCMKTSSIINTGNTQFLVRQRSELYVDIIIAYTTLYRAKSCNIVRKKYLETHMDNINTRKVIIIHVC